MEAINAPAIVHPPRSKPISLIEVQNAWKVVPTKDGAMFCTSTSVYEIMSVNQAETLRYILDTKAELDYYRNMK